MNAKKLISKNNLHWS